MVSRPEPEAPTTTTATAGFDPKAMELFTQFLEFSRQREAKPAPKMYVPPQPHTQAETEAGDMGPPADVQRPARVPAQRGGYESEGRSSLASHASLTSAGAMAQQRRSAQSTPSSHGSGVPREWIQAVQYWHTKGGVKADYVSYLSQGASDDELTELYECGHITGEAVDDLYRLLGAI